MVATNAYYLFNTTICSKLCHSLTPNYLINMMKSAFFIEIFVRGVVFVVEEGDQSHYSIAMNKFDKLLPFASLLSKPCFPKFSSFQRIFGSPSSISSLTTPTYTLLSYLTNTKWLLFLKRSNANSCKFSCSSVVLLARVDINFAFTILIFLVKAPL